MTGLALISIGMFLLAIGVLVVPHVAVLLVLSIVLDVVGLVISGSTMVRP